MMKKTISLFAVLLFMLALCANCYAAVAKVNDYSGVLTQSQGYSLAQKAESISNQYHCDVAVAFTPYVSAGKTITEDADDFYDYNGYGFGPDSDGILLYIATTDREYAISTSGKGIDYFTDAGLAHIVDKMLPHLRQSDWAGAAEVFLSQAGDFLNQASHGQPYDVNHMPGSNIILLEKILGFTGIGTLLSGLPLRKKKKEMKSIVPVEDAEDYKIKGSFSLTARDDTFINRTLNRVPIPKVQSSSGRGGGGGSSIHISSSGHSHGGTSGRF